jgi:hypothetical protein
MGVPREAMNAVLAGAAAIAVAVLALGFSGGVLAAIVWWLVL